MTWTLRLLWGLPTWTDTETPGFCCASATAEGIRLHEGDKVELFARFPAPGPEVKTVTLSAPGFPPFYDLPLGTQD